MQEKTLPSIQRVQKIIKGGVSYREVKKFNSFWIYAMFLHETKLTRRNKWWRRIKRKAQSKNFFLDSTSVRNLKKYLTTKACRTNEKNRLSDEETKTYQIKVLTHIQCKNRFFNHVITIFGQVSFFLKLIMKELAEACERKQNCKIRGIKLKSSLHVTQINVIPFSN